MYPESKLKILKDRSLMIKKVRSFFYSKKIMEVDPPSLVKHPSIDEHIESISTIPLDNKRGFLHTSPEYMMKRIIAAGIKDIFFLGHVFRKNEVGVNHNLEFTMIEWYKSKTTFDWFIKVNIALIRLFINFKKVIKITYFDLFIKNFNLDITKSTKNELLSKCKSLKIIFSNAKSIKKDDLLNLLLDYFFNEIAKKDVLYILYDFPKNQASLAKTTYSNGRLVAKRFEFFINGFELANGFFELNDEKILRKRFLKVLRIKKDLTLDEKFLKSINHIGSCYGIALGLDRLMMLKHKSTDIKNVLYFSYLDI